MTPLERACAVMNAHLERPLTPTIETAISRAIDAAVAEEREACAKIAKSLTGDKTRQTLGVNAFIVASQIENAIRARGAA